MGRRIYSCLNNPERAAKLRKFLAFCPDEAIGGTVRFFQVSRPEMQITGQIVSVIYDKKSDGDGVSEEEIVLVVHYPTGAGPYARVPIFDYSRSHDRLTKGASGDYILKSITFPADVFTGKLFTEERKVDPTRQQSGRIQSFHDPSPRYQSQVRDRERRGR